MPAANACQSPVCAPTLVFSLLLLLGLNHATAQESARRSGTEADSWADAARGGYRDDEPDRLPSFEITAAHIHAPAPAPTQLGPDLRANHQLAGVDVRLWLKNGRASFGAGVGMRGYPLSLDQARADAPTTLVVSVPTVSIGVRYQLSEHQLLFADASHARSLGGFPAAAYVTTNVGVEWKPSRPKLGFERGSFGLQLDSGYRLSLKVRHGRPMLYLRAQF